MTDQTNDVQEPRSRPASRHPRPRERLSVRIRPGQKALVEREAAFEGRSLSDFVGGSALAAATAAIRQREVITLTARDSAALVEALTNPPAPNERLREAARRYRDLVAE